MEAACISFSSQRHRSCEAIGKRKSYKHVTRVEPINGPSVLSINQNNKSKRAPHIDRTSRTSPAVASAGTSSRAPHPTPVSTAEAMAATTRSGAWDLGTNKRSVAEGLGWEHLVFFSGSSTPRPHENMAAFDPKLCFFPSESESKTSLVCVGSCATWGGPYTWWLEGFYQKWDSPLQELLRSGSAEHRVSRMRHEWTTLRIR